MFIYNIYFKLSSLYLIPISITICLYAQYTLQVSQTAEKWHRYKIYHDAKEVYKSDSWKIIGGGGIFFFFIYCFLKVSILCSTIVGTLREHSTTTPSSTPSVRDVDVSCIAFLYKCCRLLARSLHWLNAGLVSHITETQGEDFLSVSFYQHGLSAWYKTSWIWWENDDF